MNVSLFTLTELRRLRKSEDCVSYQVYKRLLLASGWKPLPLKEYVRYVELNKKAREKFIRDLDRQAHNKKVTAQYGLLKPNKNTKGPNND